LRVSDMEVKVLARERKKSLERN